jgi:hypothetical protein
MEARRIARRAKVFVLIDGELYKSGAADILMWSYCKRYMSEPVVTTPVRERLSEIFSR